MNRLPTIRHPLSGDVLTRHDLPLDASGRWTKARKAIVVRAVKAGLLTLQEATERYQISKGELESWEAIQDFSRRNTKRNRT